MSLSHEHVGSKIPAKINTFMLTRAELLIHLCYEIPCNRQLTLTVPFCFPVILVFNMTSINAKKYNGIESFLKK